MTEFDYDLAILGGGSGGYAAARTAAAGGVRTVVIEGGAEVGGLCILRGCMPTKALLHAAEVKHLAEHPQAWGLLPGKVGFDFAKVMARKNAIIKEFADYRVQQLENGRFDFLRANARFTDEHTLSLSTGQTLTAGNFVISTGSIPAPVPDVVAAGGPYLTSDDVMTMTELPKSLVVLGGGAVAVEFAQFFARFDVRVTMIQRGAQLLREFDADAADVLKGVFRREGMAVYTRTKLLGAEVAGGKKRVRFELDGRELAVEAGAALNALGRLPNTASLGLENAGVKTDNGRIICNEEMRTSAPHIFAAGDCTGPHEIVHLAVIQGEVAGHNIAQPGKPCRMDYRLLTAVVFTEPQLATVGLTEKTATAQGIPFLAASYPFADHGKSLIMEARDGFVKLLANPATGEIIGGACTGPLAGELIHEIVVAMAKRMDVRELAVVPHYHPTLAEIWTYPAEELAEGIRMHRR